MPIAVNKHRMISCDLARSSCPWFWLQDDLQDDAIFFEKTRFPTLFVLPCGRLFLKLTISHFVCVALRAAFFLKFTISHFVCVALRAASILKNHIFFMYTIWFTLQNLLIYVVLSLGSILERLVLKNGVECTSQHLKWTSGARVMTIFVYHLWMIFSVVFEHWEYLRLLSFEKYCITHQTTS